MMKKFRGSLSVIIICILALCLSGCSKIKDIKVTSMALEDVRFNSFTSVYVYLAIGIDNPAFEVQLSEIKGALKLSGKVLGRVAIDPFVLHGRSAEMYHLKALVSIEPGVSLTEIMQLLDSETLKKCMVDASARATVKGGLSTVLNFNDIPVKDLLETSQYEKI